MGRKYTIEGQRKVQNKEGQRLDSGDGDLEGILEGSRGCPRFRSIMTARSSVDAKGMGRNIGEGES